MKISSTKFRGLKIFNGKTHLDKRGAFRELFVKKRVKGFQGIFWCMSRSKKNVVRGLHIQKKINQAKYVSVVKGKIFDVALDLRKKSKTFGKYFAIILSDKNSSQFIYQKDLHMVLWEWPRKTTLFTQILIIGQKKMKLELFGMIKI